MKFKSIFLILLTTAFSCSQSGTAQSLDKQALQMKNFDFNTKIQTLLPGHLKSEDYKGYYQAKSEMIEVDTIKDGDFMEEKPVRIDYQQRSFSYDDVLAMYADFDFNAINLSTTTDGNIVMLCVVAAKNSPQDAKSFVAMLDQDHGKSKVTKETFVNKEFDVYTWKLPDRMLRYCLIYDDGKNTLALGGQPKPHYRSYFYVVKNDHLDKVLNHSMSGDFVYLQ